MIPILLQSPLEVQPPGGPSLATIRASVGRYLGFLRDSTVWTTDEAADVQEAIDEAMREIETHDWHCLKIWATLTTERETSLTLYHDQSSGATAVTAAVASGVLTLIITGGANAGTYTATLADYSILNLAAYLNGLAKGFVAAAASGVYESASDLEEFTAVSIYGSANTQTLGTQFANDYLLPAIVGGITERVYYSIGSGQYTPIDVVGEGMVVERRSYRDQTGRPEWIAIAPAEFSHSQPQRWMFMVWPRPDTVMSLRYRFRIRLSGLSDQRPWPPGTELLYQAILLGARAAAERLFNGAQSVERAAYERFVEKVKERDADSFGAKTLGINRDRSDDRRSLAGYAYPHGNTPIIWNHNGIS